MRSERRIGNIAAIGVVFALAITQAVFSADKSEAKGKSLYEVSCGTCHQMDGGGVPMMQPELIAIDRALDPVGGIIEMILKGSAAIEPGMSDYSNEMPAFDYMSDADIALIATYVRTNFENSGKAVSAADVKSLRK